MRGRHVTTMLSDAEYERLATLAHAARCPVGHLLASAIEAETLKGPETMPDFISRVALSPAAVGLRNRWYSLRVSWWMFLQALGFYVMSWIQDMTQAALDDWQVYTDIEAE